MTAQDEIGYAFGFIDKTNPKVAYDYKVFSRGGTYGFHLYYYDGRKVRLPRMPYYATRLAARNAARKKANRKIRNGAPLKRAEFVKKDTA